MDNVYWFVEENTLYYCGTHQKWVAAEFEKTEDGKWKITYCCGVEIVDEKPESIYEEMQRYK